MNPIVQKTARQAVAEYMKDKIFNPQAVKKVVITNNGYIIFPYQSISFMELVSTAIHFGLQNYIKQSMEGTVGEQTPSTLNVIAQILARLAFKYAGGFLVAIGVTTGSLVEIIIAVVIAVLGFYASWKKSKQLANAPAPPPTSALATTK